MQKVRSNQLIETVRFIACCFVVFIHCPFPNPFGSYVNMIGTSAVPFFLLLSGYFSFCDEPVNKSRKKLNETMRIAITAGAMCLIWNSLNSYLQYHDFVKWLLPYLSFRTVRNFFLFNRAVFFNSVFYYFFIMIYVYSIFILSCKLNIVKWFYMLSPFLMALLFVVATIGEWYWGGNWLFLGIPMFFLGNYLHNHSHIIATARSKEILLLFSGIVLMLIEKALKLHTPYIYIGSIIVAVSLLCLCINNSNSKCPKLLTYLGTNCSLYIMIFHCEVRDTLRLFISEHGLQFPICVLVITLILALCINHFNHITEKRQ